MSTINLSYVGKGGAGKSVWSRMMCGYFSTKGIPYLAFEANQDSPDLAAFYDEIIKENRIFEFTRGLKKDAPNKMISDLIAANGKGVATHAVVNMPAARSILFDEWVETFNVFDFLAQHNIQMVNWFVLTGDPDSIKSLRASIEQYNSKMRHVVVCNQHFVQGRELIPKDLNDVLKESKIPIINLPDIHNRAQTFVLTEQIPYELAAVYGDHPDCGVFDQHALQGILNKCFGSIDSTGIFQPDPVPSSK
jgi:hypothetical protein